MKYYIYIIHSKRLGKYYVGQSEDPWRRLKEHQESEGLKFTRQSIDWELKAVFYVSSKRADALKIETFIKKQKSRVLLEKLIDPNFILEGKLYQLVRVPHVRD